MEQHSAERMEHSEYGSTKSQAPNNKQIPMIQIPNFKQNLFGHLKLEFGAYLGFGICDFRRYALCSMPYVSILIKEEDKT
jgi:hypothetical protein